MTTKKKILVYGLSSLLIIIIIALTLLPSLSKNYLIKHGKELTGRQIDIKDLRINYFTSTLSVIGFKMFEANDKDVFTSFDTLIINTVPYKYFSNIKAIDQFYLDGLKVHVIKKDSIFNYDDLIEFFTSDSLEDQNQNDEDFKYLLNNLKLKNAEIDFYEADIDNKTILKDLSFFIPFIAWDQEHDSDADVTFNVAKGGSIQAAFHANPQTKNFNGQLNLSQINLNSFFKYATSYADINSLEGSMDSKINISGNLDALDDTEITGDAWVSDFLMTDKQDVAFLSSKNMHVNFSDIEVFKNKYVMKSVTIEQPYIKFELDSISNNLFRIFKIDEDDQQEPVEVVVEQESDTIPLYYSIKNLEVLQGTMDYTDNLTGNPFHYHLSDIKIDTDSIFSDSDWVDVDSEMLLNNRGTLKARLGVNPSDPTNAKVDIAVRDFVLSDLNLYSMYYTGHSFLEGDMYYFSQSKFTNGNILSENQLLIKGVEVHNNKNGLMSLPLKFAVFLLKDKNGDIELEIPVRGDLNEPEVDVWSLVWTTLKKVIFGATDNPTKQLAKVVNAKPKDLQEIILNYPDTTLTENQTKQIDLILELQSKKPDLHIAMNYVVDKELLKEKITGVAPDSLSVKMDAKESISDNVSITSIEQTQVSTDSIIQNYGETLIRKVKTYITEKSPDSKIEVKEADELSPDTMAADPQFKMKYSLENKEEQEN